jgi:cytochrome c biogenesis protein CcdA
MNLIPFLLAAYVGFTHAFETDHLIAVSNIVTKRNNLLLAVKDGIYWGLGHTSTILLIGTVIIIGKLTFLSEYFGYLEAGVGLMLLILGLVRLRQVRARRSGQPASPPDERRHHHLAYGVGMIHGVAGSGAMALLVMSDIPSAWGSIAYLLIFGIGSIAGMLIASGLFSLPFSRRFTGNYRLQTGLTLISSLLCIGYGLFILYENLLAG